MKTFTETRSSMIDPICIRPICFGIDLWGQSLNAGVRFGLDKVVGFSYNTTMNFTVGEIFP